MHVGVRPVQQPVQEGRPVDQAQARAGRRRAAGPRAASTTRASRSSRGSRSRRSARATGVRRSGAVRHESARALWPLRTVPPSPWTVGLEHGSTEVRESARLASVDEIVARLPRVAGDAGRRGRHRIPYRHTISREISQFLCDFTETGVRGDYTCARDISPFSGDLPCGQVSSLCFPLVKNGTLRAVRRRMSPGCVTRERRCPGETAGHGWARGCGWPHRGERCGNFLQAGLM